VTKFHADTILTSEVIDCHICICNWKGYKTPFHRSGHIIFLTCASIMVQFEMAPHAPDIV